MRSGTRWIRWGLAIVVVATAVMYLVPGNPDSPSEGVEGHFWAALGSAVLVTLVVGAMWRWILPLDRDEGRDDGDAEPERDPGRHWS